VLALIGFDAWALVFALSSVSLPCSITPAIVRGGGGDVGVMMLRHNTRFCYVYAGLITENPTCCSCSFNSYPEDVRSIREGRKCWLPPRSECNRPWCDGHGHCAL